MVGLSHLPVNTDVVVSAELALLGGLRPLYVLKAFNLPRQLAKPPFEKWEDTAQPPCDAFHFLFALPGFPSFASLKHIW